MGATQSAASGFSPTHSGCTPQVKGTGARGYSWAEIGTRLGITRQAAQQRWAESF
jgi:hypothetical protein